MNYYILNKQNIQEYIKTIDEVSKYFNKKEDLFVDEIGDGNMNYVFIIKSVE